MYSLRLRKTQTVALAIVGSRWLTYLQLLVECRVRWHACSPRNSIKQDLLPHVLGKFDDMGNSGLGFKYKFS